MRVSGGPGSANGTSAGGGRSPVRTSEERSLTPVAPTRHAHSQHSQHSHAPSDCGSVDSVTATPTLTVQQADPSESPALSTRGSDAANLGNSIFYDDTDSSMTPVLGHGGTPDPAMTAKAMEQIQSKIDKTMELIKDEQTSRDSNVDEYLKLSTNADKQQSGRIKQVFEKKNAKSAASIAHYQKKLEEYTRRMQDLQENGLRPKQRHKVGQGLKSVRDGISGMSNTVMSKPKEFAHLLRHKFGSADNLSSISKDSDSDQATTSQQKKDSNAPAVSRHRSHHGSASLPRENSGGGLSSAGRHSSFGSSNKRKCISDDGRRSGDRSESLATTNSESDKPGNGDPLRGEGVDPENESRQELRHLRQPQGASPQRDLPSTAEWKAVMQELTLHKEEVDHLREEMEETRQHWKQEVDGLGYQLREERDRYERLEEQMNDLTELHQHEVENIKTGVNDMEEKVQYQSEERLRDLKEHLQTLETKITSIEHQQTQQQYLNIDALDSTNARAVFMKLLSTLIGVVHILLLFVGTVINLLKPFLRSGPRALGTLSVVVASCAVYNQQDHLLAYIRTLKLPGKGAAAS